MFTLTHAQAARLDSFVEIVKARHPNLGGRADAAAELVRAGKVRPLGKQGARTYYEADRYTPSLEGGCTCPDAHASAPQQNGKPLCKHRLAAMFAHRLAEEKITGLAAILASAPADAESVNFRVSVIYTYDRSREQANTVEGYIYPGAGRAYTTLYPASYVEANPHEMESFRVDFAELHAALAAAGWTFETKTKQGPTREIWTFRRQDERQQRLGGVQATRVGAVAA